MNSFKFVVRFFEKKKWVVRAGFKNAADALIYARELSERWPSYRVALFEGFKINREYIFQAGHRVPH